MRQRDEEFPKDPEPGKTAKAPYTPPRLTVYGRVNDITMGGGGITGDGGGALTMS